MDGVDIVICDLNLLALSGFETIKVLKRTYSDVDYFLTSALVKEELIKNIDNLGIEAFVKKPFSIKDIIELTTTKRRTTT